MSASESGRKLQDADAASSARLVAALVGQLHHYDDLGRKARSLATSEMERINWHHSCPEWSAIWPTRSALAQAVKRLMRRKLPLTAEHLTAMARWIGADEAPSDYNFPVKSFTKAIESLNGEALTLPAKALGEASHAGTVCVLDSDEPHAQPACYAIFATVTRNRVPIINPSRTGGPTNG